MPRIFVLIVLIVLMNSKGICDEATSKEIKTWIEELDHDQYRTRQIAAKRLEQAGLPAIPFLASTAAKGSVEASSQAFRILGIYADEEDGKIVLAARKELHALAQLEGSTGKEAKSILGRRRFAYLARLESFHASIAEDDNLPFLFLNKVTDFPKLMPLLEEFPEIDGVSASNAKFGDRELGQLVHLKALTSLNLFESNVSDAGLIHLRAFKKLTHLPMGKTLVTDRGLSVVGELTQLEYLGVRGNDVSDVGLAKLAKLTNLTGLNLSETKVTDAGLKTLASFQKLQTVYLEQTAITDAGLKHLYGLKDLHSLYLFKSKTTLAGRQKLQEMLPDLIIACKTDD